MNITFPIPRYTHRDYEKWEGDWELIDGYPYAMSPSPVSKHQMVGAAIQYELRTSLLTRKKTCGCKVIYETDWIMSEGTIVRPDLCILCATFNPNDFIRIPPVLVVEIFSPSTRMKDRNVKFRLYQEYGVKYYLMADPDLKTIEYFELKDNVYREMTDIRSFQLDSACAITVDLTGVFTDL